MRYCFYIFIFSVFAILKGNDPKDLYLDLMKKCLTNSIYEKCKNCPQQRFTMIGLIRLNNIQDCLIDILEKNIPGDCIETGVWRGGATIFMRSILKAYGDTNRKVWAADSFKGFPKVNLQDYPQDINNEKAWHTHPHLVVSLKTVKKNFQKYNLLDNQVVFLEGWFRDTLPKAPIKEIALLRLDGDLYESTWLALIYLYPKLSIGGYIIIDDYNSWTSCKSAVDDYREKYNIHDKMIEVGQGCIYWQKTQ